MTPSGYFVDTNILLLMVVGNIGRELISRHWRLDGYSASDYDILRSLLRNVRRVFVTPNTLTETSNLLGQHHEPERSRLFQGLRAIILESEEIVIPSTVASGHSAFPRLGLTDTALLEAVSAETPLLTVDHNLYTAALHKGEDAVVNFTAFRAL